MITPTFFPFDLQEGHTPKKLELDVISFGVQQSDKIGTFSIKHFESLQLQDIVAQFSTTRSLFSKHALR